MNWINLHSGIISSSISRVQIDHSICTAVMGCTACALLIVSGLASDRPIYLTFPSFTSFLSSPTYIPKICIKSNLPPGSHHLQWNNECREFDNFKLWTSKNFVGIYWKSKRITYSVFYGYFCVYPMLIIQINVLHIKTLQASLTAWANILRATVHLHVRKSYFFNAKFGGYLNFLSWQLLQGLKDINFFQVIAQSFNMVLIINQFTNNKTYRR